MEGQVAAEEAVGGERGRPQPSFPAFLLRIFVLYTAFQWFSKLSKPQSPLKNTTVDEHGNRVPVADPQNSPPSLLGNMGNMLGIQEQKKIPIFPHVDDLGRKIPLHRCTFRRSQRMELYVYLQEGEPGDAPPQRHERISPDAQLVWHQKDLTFDTKETNRRSLELDLPPSVNLKNNNGTMFARIFLAKEGVPPDPADVRHREADVAVVSHQLNLYRPMRKTKYARSLLGGNQTAEEVDLAKKTAKVEASNVTIANYWKPTMELKLVEFSSDFQRNEIPQLFGEQLEFHMATGNYFPILYVSEFWLQSKHYLHLNETVTSLPLKVTWEPLGQTKWQIMSSMEKQWAMQQKMGVAESGDNDTLLEMLSETSPWLLVVTFTVSCLHSLFDFLAFKNDVSFWRKNKSLAGLSVRAMVTNFFFQAVIFLYLVDNETSTMILISTGIGLAIELWKLCKAFTAKLDWSHGTLPRLTFKASESYSKSVTKEYDEIATAHLMYIVLPLMVGYAMYSLLQQQHKGWYSWILTSLVGFVYMFGFINMTPQLFINYKLQSVAHLPWRSMVYKSLNTFIDDLFSFIIKMPLMHRLACFRDDIIFFIYLYQRWIYRTDHSRPNEYGQVAVAGDEQETLVLDNTGTPTQGSETRTLLPQERAAQPVDESSDTDLD